MSEAKRRREDDSSEDEVPLHYILELFFGDDLFISRDKIQSLLAQATKTLPYSLLKPWKCLRQLIESWTKYQEQTMPNQEHHEEEYQKIYNPLRCGHCSYSQFLSEEELCMMSFPQEMMEMLRQFALRLSNALSSEQLSTQSPPYPFTPETRPCPTSMSSTTVAGQTGAADVLHLLASYEDQTARQFGLQTQPHGTSTISSSISIASPDSWNTLKWEEPTGVVTVELKLWNNANVQDTSPQEFWKYCSRSFRVQLHATSPAEVHKAVQTLMQYAHERVQKAESVQKSSRRNPSMTTYGKTPYRR